MIQQTKYEKEILKRIDHPFCIHLFGTFADKRYLYLVLDFVAGGELFTHLREEERLTSEAARFYAASVASVFHYIHLKDVIYRDLKPENLLFNWDGYLKVTDFGTAKVLNDQRTKTLQGTHEYLAPEILLNKGYTLAIDWWTLGILIFEMITGDCPWINPEGDQDDPLPIFQGILTGRVVFPKYFCKYAKDTVKKFLVVDVEQRFGGESHGFEEIKQTAWFSGLDFDALLDKKLPVPFKPDVSGPTDTKNFETDMYPDSDELPPTVEVEVDAFLDW